MTSQTPPPTPPLVLYTRPGIDDPDIMFKVAGLAAPFLAALAVIRVFLW